MKLKGEKVDLAQVENKDMIKVDVILQVYGKPWQTLCTIESLMQNSGQHIDKIYLMEEFKHPFKDNISEVFKYDYPIVHKKHKKWVNIYGTWAKDVPEENIRHQWGLEQSDKQYVFVMHNDVLFTGDIIGNMLQEIGTCIAIGEIGQCWNCPAFSLCGGGETWNDWNPTYEEISDLPLPHIRTRKEDLDKNHPKLMPECRVNEWAILLNREICIKEGKPYFGEFVHDSGTEWFKEMYRRGYAFKDYRKDFIHAYWANISGHEVEQQESLYWETEKIAKNYFFNVLKKQKFEQKELKSLSDFFETFPFQSDKNTSHCYIDQYYSPEFLGKQTLPLKILEVGIREGLSHILWEKYFSQGEIWGVDNGESGFDWPILNGSSVKIFKENAYSTIFTDKLPKEYFDYIIEDGSHLPEHQLKSIELYLPLIKSEGKLIIEDVGNINLANQLKQTALKNKMTKEVKIVDLRHIKNRWDDILIEITKK